MIAMAKWTVLAVLCVPAGAAFAESASEQPDPTVERAGDYLQVGIPLAALGLTFLLGDDEEGAAGASYAGSGLALDTGWLYMNGSPRHDLLLAIGRTELATYSLKYSINSERPNGSGQSFPSGHTSIAFAGAEFIRKQYGWWWGVPSYLAASYVGWSRVETKNHWTTDVVAGAAIGILSNHDQLSFQLPLGARGLQLSVAPTLLLDAPSPGFAGQKPPGLLEQLPAPGLHIELRF